MTPEEYEKAKEDISDGIKDNILRLTKKYGVEPKVDNDGMVNFKPKDFVGHEEEFNTLVRNGNIKLKELESKYKEPIVTTKPTTTTTSKVSSSGTGTVPVSKVDKDKNIKEDKFMVETDVEKAIEKALENAQKKQTDAEKTVENVQKKQAIDKAILDTSNFAKDTNKKVLDVEKKVDVACEGIECAKTDIGNIGKRFGGLEERLKKLEEPTFVCDNCGEDIIRPLSSYCPNCGDTIGGWETEDKHPVAGWVHYSKRQSK